MYLWLHWVFDVVPRLFVALSKLSPVSVSGSYSLVVMHRLLITVASLVVEHGRAGFSS